jgi:hypothetical protein
MKYDLEVLSLGAGVQSSALALMADAGEFGPKPDCAIFADTGGEPEDVYQWLSKLRGLLSYPVHIVSNGDLAEDSLQLKTSRPKSKSPGKAYVKSLMPLFMLSPDGTRGMLPRRCTKDYKITPIRREVRRLLKEAGLKASPGAVRQWIGISSDEVHRMKDSPVKYINNWYPLIMGDRTFSRQDCIKWMEDKGWGIPKRSACGYCPYHSDAEWSRIARDSPESFERAVTLEKSLQKAYLKDEFVKGIPYLHASCVPLEKALFDELNQLDLFGEECEGMCGL